MEYLVCSQLTGHSLNLLNEDGQNCVQSVHTQCYPPLCKCHCHLKQDKNFIFMYVCVRSSDWLTWDWVQDLTVLMHLGLNWWVPCAPYQFMGALLLYQSSRWPPDLYSQCPLAPRKRAQICMSEWSKSVTLTKNVGRDQPLFHTSHTMNCLIAPSGEHVSSEYYVQ